jgi:ATP-dependent metalloprotease
LAAGLGMKFQSHQKRLMSSYVGSLARRVRDIDGSHEAALLKDLYRSDAEGVIRIFESHPSLQSNPAALSEYLKALVAVDRLDESALLKTLHQGEHQITYWEYLNYNFMTRIL